MPHKKLHQNHTIKHIAFFIIMFISSLPGVECSDNPLSKIIITSKEALCKKDPFDPNLFSITYSDQVHVALADGTTIQSGLLKIVIQSDLLTTKQAEAQSKSINELVPQKTSHNNLSQFKAIILEKDVRITSQNRNIQAQRAELFPEKRICRLKDNVIIDQKKENPTDIPIHTTSSEVLINLDREEIGLIGSREKPVCTRIEIAGYPKLLKKVNTKREKTAERKAQRMAQNKKKHNEQNKNSTTKRSAKNSRRRSR